MINNNSNNTMKQLNVKVLHVIGIMNRGGAETMIMNLYRKIDRTKIQFDFVENSLERAVYDDEIESLGGIIYRCPHFYGKNYLQYKKWWKNFFQQHKGEYHIIHGHIGSTAAIYLQIAKKNGLFTIAHSHNTKSVFSIGSLLYRMMSFPTRYIADYFFGCSDEAGIDRFGKRVVNSNRYKTFHNAIDTKLFKFDYLVRNQVRDELGIMPDEVVIGHIGRFEKQKNHDFLIDIFGCCKERNPNCKLLLVGDGLLREYCERKIKRLHLDQSVIFTGVRSDVYRLVQAMDVFVFPSLFEGLGIVLIESQASGLLCVISDKVAKESILNKQLVSVCNLSDSPDVWAKRIFQTINTDRYGCWRLVAEKGYDVFKTANELEKFYYEIVKK